MLGFANGRYAGLLNQVCESPIGSTLRAARDLSQSRGRYSVLGKLEVVIPRRHDKLTRWSLRSARGSPVKP